MKTIILLCLISIINSQYNQKITYLEYVNPTSTSSDFHKILVTYNPGALTLPSPTLLINGQTWKVTAIRGSNGGNTSDNTNVSYDNILIYSKYLNYLPELGGSFNRYCVYWNTDSSTNSNDITCDSSNVASILLRLKCFTCKLSAQELYASITTDVPKCLLNNDGSIDSQVKGYTVGGTKVNDNSVNNFCDIVVGTTNIFTTICP